jgi:hypothetical protein
LQAHFVDGEPIDDAPAVMAKIEDRHRTFVIDDTPTATGVLAVADSWACTNPSLGRGITIGALHAVALRDLLHDGPGSDPVELARRWHDDTNATVETWYRGTLDFDEGRLAQIEAEIADRRFEPEPEFELQLQLGSAAGKDGDMLREMLKIIAVLEPPSKVFADPAVAKRAAELGAGWREEALPGLTREELLAAVGEGS